MEKFKLHEIPYIVIIRDYQEKQTKGEAMVVLKDVDPYQFKTLELPWLNNQRRISCIPEGQYKCVKHKSPKFGNSFWVKDVPGRSEILIHVGNYAASKNPKTGVPDTLGCILPGVAFADIDGDGYADITSSGAVMKKLYEIMPDEFNLIIKS
jgi:hypothetical protein